MEDSYRAGFKPNQFWDLVHHSSLGFTSPRKAQQDCVENCNKWDVLKPHVETPQPLEALQAEQSTFQISDMNLLLQKSKLEDDQPGCRAAAAVPAGPARC